MQRWRRAEPRTIRPAPRPARGSACLRRAPAAGLCSRPHLLAGLRKAEDPPKPRPHAARTQQDDGDDGNAPYELLDALEAKALGCAGDQLAEREQQKGASTGPNRVPTPPTIGANVISIDLPMSNAISGNRLL